MGAKTVDETLPFFVEKVLLENTDGILDEKTGRATARYQLSLSEIVQHLEDDYGFVAPKTQRVRKILEAQLAGADSAARNPGTEPVMIGELSTSTLWCRATSAAINAPRYYFVVRSLQPGQIEHLIQLVRSTSASGDAKPLFYALAGQTCEADAAEIRAIADQTLQKTNPFHAEFINTQQTIAKVRLAVSKQRSLSYTYVGDGAEGVRHIHEIPLCVEIMEGYPYLVMWIHTKRGVWVMKNRRIDVMHNVCVDAASEGEMYPENYDELVDNAHEWLRAAVNRMPGKSAQIKARCHNLSMTKYVEDIFGNKENFAALSGSPEGAQDYRFVASTSGTIVQALKWCWFFEILEPAWLRQEVINALTNNPYGTFDCKPPTRTRRIRKQ